MSLRLEYLYPEQLAAVTLPDEHALILAKTQPIGCVEPQQLNEWAKETEIATTKDGDKRSYVVRIRNLPSKAEANALAGELRGKHGVAEPKVSS